MTALAREHPQKVLADEALRAGLVNRVVPTERTLDEAIRLAAEIANRAPLALRLAKEAVNAAFEMPLAGSMAYERRLFYLLFGTEDQKEGMDAPKNERKRLKWSIKLFFFTPARKPRGTLTNTAINILPRAS